MSTLQNTDVFAVTRGTDTYKVSFADVVAGVPIPSVLTYQGTADPAATAPAPAGGLKAGMVYVLTPAGTLEASWTGIGGKHADDGQLAIWEGAKWELVGNTGAIPAASDSVLGLVQLADAAAITAGTATRVVDAAQLKAAVAAEDLWDRTGTTLTTKTAGDKVDAAALPAATTTVAGAVQLADAAAVTAGTAGRVVDAAQLKAVSDAATAADEWTRTGTEISPKTAGDSVFTSGAVKVGGTTAAPNLQIKGDGGIVANTDGLVYDAAQKRLGLGTSSPSGLFDARGFSYLSGAQIRDSSHVAKGYVQGDARGFLLATDGSTDIVFDVNGTERVRLDTSGRLGIGVTPAQLLHLKAAAGSSILRIEDSGANCQLDIKGNAGDGSANIFQTQNYALTFGTNNLERGRFTNDGKFLVGTSSTRGNFFNTTGQDPLLQVEASSQNTLFSTVYNSNDGAGVNLVLGKTRGTSVGSNTVVQSGDRLGSLSFQGADGSELVEGASIQAFVDGTPGANDMPGRLVFSTTKDGQSSPVERTRITQDGSLRHIADSEAFYLSTTLAAGALNALMAGYYSGTAGSSLGTNCFLILTNGNVRNTNGSYTTISDAKLKENIVDAGSQWNDLKAIQIRNWNFKAETGYETHRQIGPIAQELKQVCPGLVFETPDRDADGNDLGTTTKGVNQSILYMKAVKALQEAMERIEALEAKVAALEAS